jgi:hypothetical protein
MCGHWQSLGSSGCCRVACRTEAARDMHEQYHENGHAVVETWYVWKCVFVFVIIQDEKVVDPVAAASCSYPTASLIQEAHPS